MFSDKLSLTPRTKALIMILDGLILVGVACLVYWFRFQRPEWALVFDPILWILNFFWLSALYVFGLYDLDRDSDYAIFAVRIIVSVLIVLGAGSLMIYLSGQDRAGLLGRGVLVGSLLVNGFVSLVLRWFLWRAFYHLQSGLEVLVLTSQGEIERIQNEFKKNHFIGRLSCLTENQWGEISEHLKQKRSLVVIGTRERSFEEKMGAELLKLRFSGNTVWDLSSFYETLWRKIPVFHLSTQWFFTKDGFSLIGSPLRLRVKRLSDVFLASLLLILTSPLMILTALMVRLDSRGPVLYKQVRTGKDGENFVIMKFRSMRIDAEASGAVWAQKNDSRVTKVGRFIRLTRLDELPQLFNVLRGDMSFIGPRPERPEFNQDLERQIPYYQLRHSVRPGITGWAQVMYPYGASVDDAREKLQFDLYYIKKFSFVLDLQIVLKTISVVLLGQGR